MTAPSPGARTVVITDCDHGSIAQERSVLDGHRVELRLANCATAEDVVEQAGDATVLINQYAPITGEVLAALPAVRLVVRYGVGVDNVDVPAATARGVWVANVPDYGTTEVADHAIALTMTLLRGVATLDRSVRAGRWDYVVARPLRRLSELVFGVVGSGAIGAATAERARALGMRVIASDPVASRPRAAHGVEKVAFYELLAAADIVSVHATLDASSYHLIGERELGLMKPTAYLVNTARGGLVDSSALLAALDAGRLAGVGLDVLETEPPEPAMRRLVEHERAVVTPHAAWYSEDSFAALKSEVAREALRVLDGGAPRSPVNSLPAPSETG